MSGRRPNGLRVLLVEDQLLVARDIEAMLLELGCIVVGPVGRLSQALPLATTEPLDAAILDVNLDDGTAAPLAAELARRRIPFVLVTGYIRPDLSPIFADRVIVEKPFTGKDIETAVWAMCS